VSFKIGDTLRYEFIIEDIILSGGMGEVYVIRNKKNPLLCVAKTFKKDYFSKPELIDRFVREAKIWVGLGAHINIVKALNVYHIEGRPFIIMEYIPGGSLEALIRNKRPTVEQALSIGIQICNGMAYVHETAGVIHCDLKPANIMIDANSLIKVTDFGLAAVIRDWVVGKAEKAGGVGTFPYMAPEQFIPEGSVQFSTDIYALGVILFRLLAGQYPFEGYTWQDFYSQHADGKQPPKLRNINSEVNENLENIVFCCLEKEPSRRYQSFRELKKTLEQLYYNIKGQSFSLLDEQEQQEKKYAVIEKTIIPVTEQMKRCFEIYNNAVTKFELGERGEALNLFDEALRVGSDFADAWNGKGNALAALNRSEEAEECYKKAVQLNPEMPEAWVNLGKLYVGIEKYEDSLQCLNKALEVGFDIAPFWAIHADILLKLNRLPEAMDSINKALDLNPKCTNALFLKAQLLIRDGYNDNAVSYLSRLLEVNSREVYALQLKANLLLNKKAFAAALECFNALCEIQPETVEYIKQKGFCCAELGDFDEALSCFKRSTELDVADADAWYNLGFCLHMLGKTEEAKDCYLKTISITPGHFKTCNNLGAYYFAKEEYNEALKWFEKAMRIDPLHEDVKKRIHYVRELMDGKDVR